MARMANETIYKPELTRIDICDLLLAALEVKWGAIHELNDPETTETRKQILQGTIEKWEGIHARLNAQLDKLDKEHGIK